MKHRKNDMAEPDINIKAKKNSMLFEYVLITILILFLIYIFLDVLGIWGVLLKSSTTSSNNKSVTLTSVASAVIALYALVWQLHSAIQAKRVLVELDMSTEIEGFYVTLSCSIKNAGTKSIYPNLTNLYITEGIADKKDSNGLQIPILYQFEPITEHRIDRSRGECFDCKIAEYCKKNGATEDGEIDFPEKVSKEFAGTLRYCCNLRQLSYFTLVHIMPQETFRQDIVLKIPKPGVYRAFVIYTGRGWDDCICTTKIFRIKEDM